MDAAMAREILKTLATVDMFLGVAAGGVTVWLVKNPSKVVQLFKGVVGISSGNGHKNGESLTILEHDRMCNKNLDPLKKDISELRIEVTETRTDVGWIKKRLEDGEMDFRELNRKIDELAKNGRR